MDYSLQKAIKDIKETIHIYRARGNRHMKSRSKDIQETGKMYLAQADGLELSLYHVTKITQV